MFRRALILATIMCCVSYVGYISDAQVEYQASLTDKEAFGTVNVTNYTMNTETEDPEMIPITPSTNIWAMTRTPQHAIS